MEKTVTLEMTEDQAKQLNALIEKCLETMDRALDQISKDNLETEKSQVRTWAILNELKRSLNVEEPF